MAAVEINWNPSEKELRWFAGLQVLFFCAVAWLILRQSGSTTAASLIAGAAILAGVAGIVKPATVRPYYLAWMVAVYPIGWVMSHLILAGVYYLVLTPIGLLLRLTGRDPMQRRPDSEATSYWQQRPERDNPDRYFRQY